MHAAVDAAFDDPRCAPCVDEVVAALASGPGWSNALSAKLVALTVPGVPDVYQGSELWEQSLVDPDNRRPVDYDVRARWRDRLRAGAPCASDARSTTTAAASCCSPTSRSRVRRDRPELLDRYQPLEAVGAGRRARAGLRPRRRVAVGTRLPVGLRRARRLGRHVRDAAAGRRGATA